MSSEEEKAKTGATHRPYDEAFKRAAVAQWQSGVPARRVAEGLEDFREAERVPVDTRANLEMMRVVPLDGLRDEAAVMIHDHAKELLLVLVGLLPGVENVPKSDV